MSVVPDPQSPSGFRPRALLLIDMNAFFAAIEQHDSPELRDRRHLLDLLLAGAGELPESQLSGGSHG